MLIDCNVSFGFWPFQKFRLDTPAKLARQLENKGVSRGLVSAVESVLYPDPAVYNGILAKKLSGYDSLVPIRVVNPLLGNWREELDKVDRRRAKVIKIVPNYHQYELADACFEKLAGESSERGMNLLVQMRVEDERAQYAGMKTPGVDVDELIKAAKKFPDINFICLCPYFREAVALANSAKNIYVDISFVESSDTLADLTGKVGAEQVVFGSHTPFLYTDGAVMKIKSASISKKDIKMIGSGNIRKLL